MTFPIALPLSRRFALMEDSTDPLAHLRLSPSQVLREWAAIEAGPLRMFQPLRDAPRTPVNMVLRGVCFDRVIATRGYFGARSELIQEYVFGVGSARPIIVATFAQILGDSLATCPIYRSIEALVASEDECAGEPGDTALVPATVAAHSLRLSVSAVSKDFDRGNIPGAERRGRRLWVPIGYIRGKVASRGRPK